MPELPVKEVRPSELHLPEIKRDQIVRSLSEIHLPSVDLSKVERPTFDLPDALSRIDWRPIGIGEALAGAAAIARVGRPVMRRSRFTIAMAAVIVAGLATAALLSNPAGRERAARTVRGMRAKMEMRGASTDRLEVDQDVPASSVPTEPASLETPGSPAPEEAASLA